MEINIKQLNLAKNYANAFFKIAQQFNCAEKFYSELKSVVEVLKNSPDLKTYMNNPLISVNDKKDVVYKVFGKDFDIQIINLLNLLVDNKRFDIVEAVMVSYSQLYEENAGVIKIDVFSVIDLNEETKSRLVEKLERKLNKKVYANYMKDENILGGLVIKIGDKVIDLSLSSKITNMEKQLIKG